METTGTGMWWYELIEDRHPNLVLAHLLQSKGTDSSRINTERLMRRRRRGSSGPPWSPGSLPWPGDYLHTLDPLTTKIR
ncbi:MAG: hypothetical protein NW703_07395 [Nitrospiraceae bacterium]